LGEVSQSVRAGGKHCPHQSIIPRTNSLAQGAERGLGWHWHYVAGISQLSLGRYWLPVSVLAMLLLLLRVVAS
jgi:hypothetical protein